MNNWSACLLGRRPYRLRHNSYMSGCPGSKGQLGERWMDGWMDGWHGPVHSCRCGGEFYNRTTYSATGNVICDSTRYTFARLIGLQTNTINSISRPPLPSPFSARHATLPIRHTAWFHSRPCSEPCRYGRRDCGGWLPCQREIEGKVPIVSKLATLTYRQ